MAEAADAKEDFASGYCEYAGIETDNPVQDFDDCADAVSEAYSEVGG